MRPRYLGGGYHIYIYIYTDTHISYTERERERESARGTQMGFCTNNCFADPGVLQAPRKPHLSDEGNLLATFFVKGGR